jgi:hypothetical protein
LRKASLDRLIDPGVWLARVAHHLRDKGESMALARWEGMTHAERIAEAVAALEITAEKPRGVWDAYARHLILEAMAGGRSLAQERAAGAQARASPTRAPDIAKLFLESFGEAPGSGPTIDITAEKGDYHDAAGVVPVPRSAC